MPAHLPVSSLHRLPREVAKPLVNPGHCTVRPEQAMAPGWLQHGFHSEWFFYF